MKKESIDRRRFLQALGLFALAGVGSAARAQEGKTFVELSPAQPTLAGKIEVIEFFHYGCPHCRHLDPLVEGWKKTLGGDVAFHRSPVIWGQGALAGLARLYFSLEATGQLEALHPKIFAAVQDERRLVYDRDGARALYRELGALLRRHPGWKLGAISADPGFERAFGRRADRKRRLYNGRLECDFFLYL